MLCQSCECVFINGLKCHEPGCPDAWKDYTVECRECGCKFTPEEKGQIFCSEECAESYYL